MSLTYAKIKSTGLTLFFSFYATYIQRKVDAAYAFLVYATSPPKSTACGGLQSDILLPCRHRGWFLSGDPPWRARGGGGASDRWPEDDMLQ